MTGPAKTGHLGTKYTLLLNGSYLVTGIEMPVIGIVRYIVKKLKNLKP